VGLAVPRALGVGYDVIGDLLGNKLAVGTIAVLAAAKLAAWWLALGSGTSGGTLAPLLMISAAYGRLFGAGVHAVLPGVHVSPGAFAVVAMAAVFGASTRATFASMVFVFELTRDFDILLPLMLASVIADLVAAALMKDSIMTEKLSRRGLRVHAEYEVDHFRMVPVGEIMTTDVHTLAASATVAEARARLEAGPHGAYPLVDDDGRCVGIVARGDLLRDCGDDDEPVLAHASADVVSVTPQDLAITALQRMLEESVEHVPVVDSGRLVGICTRTDVLRVRLRQLDHERNERGWLQVRPVRFRT
jgi:chloride channel protein, CIC family